jgi:hypothetical protein
MAIENPKKQMVLALKIEKTFFYNFWLPVLNHG